jgi:hypothetical protein
LYDVAIINDTLAYAVGEIYQDYTKDYQIYNAAKWNGKTWELMRVPSRVCGSDEYCVRKLSTIFAFNQNDIWYSDGGEMIHWNGTSYTNDCSMNPWLTGSINKLWGTSSSDIYAVGNNGLIAHYDGRSWSKIESGTTLQFLDIYGAKDLKSSEYQILAVCTQNYPPGKGLFSIQGDIAKEISSNIPSNQLAELFSVWFVPNRHYYIVGDGIYEKFVLTESEWKNSPLDITRYATTKIRGNGLNNIFIVGAYGECLHWNGASWKSYREITGLSTGSYTSVGMNGNSMIAVGADGRYAIIIIGKR